MTTPNLVQFMQHFNHSFICLVIGERYQDTHILIGKVDYLLLGSRNDVIDLVLFLREHRMDETTVKNRRSYQLRRQGYDRSERNEDHVIDVEFMNRGIYTHNATDFVRQVCPGI